MFVGPLFQVFTPDGSIVDGEILDHKNGTYEFVYIVPKEGDFSLALRLYDQHIKGSPFKLTVSRVSEVEVGGAIWVHVKLKPASYKHARQHFSMQGLMGKDVQSVESNLSAAYRPPFLSPGVPLHHHGDQLSSLRHPVHGLL